MKQLSLILILLVLGCKESNQDLDGLLSSQRNQPPETSAKFTSPTPGSIFLPPQVIVIEVDPGPSLLVGYEGNDGDGVVVDYEFSIQGPKVISWISLKSNPPTISDSFEAVIEYLQRGTVRNLPRGSYTLRVRAVDDEGAKDPTPAEVRFTIPT